MHRYTLLLLLASTLLAQPAKPFQATAELGKPFVIGSERYIGGSKKQIETATLREVTLRSAELALTFSNRVELIIAKADEKLLILKGSMRNPEKTTTMYLTASSLFGFNTWERYTGKGEFEYIAQFDPETLQHQSIHVKPGESKGFIGAWRIPADFTDFRLGLAYRNPSRFAWYDLNAVIQPLKPVVPAIGSPFNLDGLELTVGAPADPAMFAGYARDPAKPRRVISVSATNKMLLPLRWGWQYFTVELLFADGTAVKAYNEIVDQATGKPWAGDLAAGASTTGAFHFYPDKARQIRAIRFSVIATGRSVEIVL